MEIELSMKNKIESNMSQLGRLNKVEPVLALEPNQSNGLFPAKLDVWNAWMFAHCEII